MPLDFELTSDRDIRIDETGDWGTVAGRDNIEQQHVNAIFRGVEEADVSLLNRNGIEDYRIALQRALDEMPYVESYNISLQLSPPRGIRVRVDSNALDQPVNEEVNI